MFRSSKVILSIAAIGISGCGFFNPTPSTSPTSTHYNANVVLFYVGLNANGFDLYSETHPVTSNGDDALAAAHALLEFNVTPFDGDYSSFWATAGGSANSLVRSGSKATIDISVADAETAAMAEKELVEQLIWTLFANDATIDSVQITVDGKRIATLAGRISIQEPFVRPDGFGILSNVQIDSPSDESDVINPVTVTGMSCTFEAVVVWELVQNDAVINSGNTLAAEACPTRAPFTINLGTLSPGTYEISAFEVSAKDGSRVSEDSKTFTVQ